MATSRTIEIPQFDFTNEYYPDIYSALIQYQRIHVPEITDESEEEPFQQLLKCYSLVGHLNNVLLDVAANESLLTTSRLLESVRGHLALIDVYLRQATPASVDMVLELSKTFLVATELVPENTQFATVETEEFPQVIYETNESLIVEPSNVPTTVYNFDAGLIEIVDNNFDAGDSVSVRTVEFREGVEWAAGVDIAVSLQNLVNAINSTSNELVKDKVHALTDGVSKISLIRLDDEITTIAIAKNDGATLNFNISDGGFGSNKAGLASTNGVFFDMFTSPKKGDIINIGHTNVMVNTLEWLFNTVGSGIKSVLEFYDGDLEDAKPDEVTNLGSTLEIDVTSLLGTEDRSGAIIRVILSSTGANETVVSSFSAGKNIITTKGLLGQSAVSLDENDYIIGSNWNEVNDFADTTNELSEDGKMSFTLPQSQSQSWIKNAVNGVDGFWLRLRIVEVTAPVNPNVDRILIDSGKQYVFVVATQGQTVSEQPLGSSNGGDNQEFLLTHKPMIEGTLLIEVDEGSGFQPWNLKENFLSSNSSSKDYTLEIDSADEATIKFGNSIQGKIPTPGIDNIRALYRVGADVNGNVGAKTITVNKSGISFLNRVYNPRQANGWSVKEGSTDEDLARLKVEGPATLRTRERGITVPDMEFLATQYVDANGSELVARALGIEEVYGVKTVELVVVGFGGVLLTELQREELQTYFNGDKTKNIDPVIVANHEATVVNYTPKETDVDAVVTGGNEEEISNAITALLNPEAVFVDGVTKRWKFGQAVPLSVINSVIFEVDPVNIKKVILTVPQAVGDEIPMNTRELPLARTITVTVN